MVKVQLGIKKVFVIDITSFYAQDQVELLTGIDGVPYPVDVPEIILSAFIDLNIDIDRLFIMPVDGIPYYLCIPETQGVIFFYEFLFILFVVVFDKLGGFKDPDPELQKLINAYAGLDGSLDKLNEAMMLMGQFCSSVRRPT